MTLNLTSLPRGVERKTFHYDDSCNIVDPNDKDAKPSVFSLDIEWISERDRQKYYDQLQDELLQRVAANKKGQKKFKPDAGGVERRIAKKALAGWNMTVAGLYALELPRDLSGLDPNHPVEFSDQNVEAVINESKQLLNLIHNALNDHELWFSAPGSEQDKADEGNSENGPSSSSEQ